jgi:hypothetical protein
MGMWWMEYFVVVAYGCDISEPYLAAILNHICSKTLNTAIDELLFVEQRIICKTRSTACIWIDLYEHFTRKHVAF